MIWQAIQDVLHQEEPLEAYTHWQSLLVTMIIDGFKCEGEGHGTG